MNLENTTVQCVESIPEGLGSTKV